MTVTAVYAVATVVGLLGLAGWVLTRSLAVARGSGFDPEERFGTRGRRALAAVVGFGLGGMSASFSPLEPSSLLVALAALVGAVAAAWYAGWVGSAST